MHGSNPAICKYGCKPVVSTAFKESPEQRLWREAAEFLDQYAREMGVSDEVPPPAYWPCAGFATRALLLLPSCSVVQLPSAQLRPAAPSRHGPSFAMPCTSIEARKC